MDPTRKIFNGMIQFAEDVGRLMLVGTKWKTVGTLVDAFHRLLDEYQKVISSSK